MPTIPLRVCDQPARVARVVHPCREHVEIELTLRGFPASHPGQFLQLLCREDESFDGAIHDWQPGQPVDLVQSEWREREAYLRRPFSIADRWDDADGVNHLVVISRAIGPGTRWLDCLSVDDGVSVTGPLGTGFQIPPPGVTLVLVGGGAGIPPLIYLARVLAAAGREDVFTIFGATSGDLLPLRLTATPSASGEPTHCVELAGESRYPAIVTSDDGTLGLPGRVTDALERWHERVRILNRPVLVLACGPDGMLHALSNQTRRLNMACQLCIEKPMGCGLGTCLSCVARVVDPTSKVGWRWALACQDGPVFERDVLHSVKTETRA